MWGVFIYLFMAEDTNVSSGMFSGDNRHVYPLPLSVQGQERAQEDFCSP